MLECRYIKFGFTPDQIMEAKNNPAKLKELNSQLHEREQAWMNMGKCVRLDYPISGKSSTYATQTDQY